MWWKKVTFHNYFLASATLNVLSAAGILSLRSFLPPLVPLFYGNPSGADQLAPALFLLIIPGVSILISGINIILSILAKDEFIKKILPVGSFIISVMATITIVKIVLLVGFF